MRGPMNVRLILSFRLGVQFLSTRGLTDKQTNTADTDIRSAGS